MGVDAKMFARIKGRDGWLADADELIAAYDLASTFGYENSGSRRVANTIMATATTRSRSFGRSARRKPSGTSSRTTLSVGLFGRRTAKTSSLHPTSNSFVSTCRRATTARSIRAGTG